MTPKVVFRDKEGKRRVKSVRCSILAEPDEVIREFHKANEEKVGFCTYVYQVKQGAQTTAWHDIVLTAFL